MFDNFKGIYYQVIGDPGRSPILFLHGFLGDNREWQEVIDIVSKNNYCITIDLPGHGKSNNPDVLKNVWNFKSLSIKINELLVHLGFEKIFLVGYSMGGRIAQYFAVNFPESVLKLVLESSSAGIKAENERLSRLQNDKTLIRRLHNEPLNEFLKIWYDQPLFYGIKNHPKYADLIKRRVTNDQQLLAKALAAFGVGIQPYLADKLSLLGIPVLLLCGAYDLKYMEIMKNLKQNNPGFELSVINHVGHNIHFEKPILFAEHLVEFLSL